MKRNRPLPSVLYCWDLFTFHETLRTIFWVYETLNTNTLKEEYAVQVFQTITIEIFGYFSFMQFITFSFDKATGNLDHIRRR